MQQERAREAAAGGGGGGGGGAGGSGAPGGSGVGGGGVGGDFPSLSTDFGGGVNDPRRRGSGGAINAPKSNEYRRVSCGGVILPCHTPNPGGVINQPRQVKGVCDFGFDVREACGRWRCT